MEFLKEIFVVIVIWGGGLFLIAMFVGWLLGIGV